MPFKQTRIYASTLFANQRSKSLAESCADALPVSTSIWPCGLIRTAEIDSPALLTASIARVRSVRRKVCRAFDIAFLPIKNPAPRGWPLILSAKGSQAQLRCRPRADDNRVVFGGVGSDELKNKSRLVAPQGCEPPPP